MLDTRKLVPDFLVRAMMPKSAFKGMHIATVDYDCYYCDEVIPKGEYFMYACGIEEATHVTCAQPGTLDTVKDLWVDAFKAHRSLDDYLSDHSIFHRNAF